MIVAHSVQVVMAGMIWLGWMNGKAKNVPAWRDALIKAYQDNDSAKQLLDTLVQVPDLDIFAQELQKQQQYLINLCEPSPVSTKS